jgi:hypothetical protein
MKTIAATAVVVGGLVLILGGAILAGVGTILVVVRLLGVGEGFNEPWAFVIVGFGLGIAGFAMAVRPTRRRVWLYGSVLFALLVLFAVFYPVIGFWLANR